MEFNKKLIHAVKKRDALYNLNHEDYKKHAIRSELWHEVATEINIDVDQCRKRWKNLRGRYAREYYTNQILTDAGIKMKKKCIYFNFLKFLNPFLTKQVPVKTDSNSTDCTSKGNKTATRVTTQPASKIVSSQKLNQCWSCRERERNENLIDKDFIDPEYDNVDVFLMNLRQVLKSFDPITRLEVQMDLHGIILKQLNKE